MPSVPFRDTKLLPGLLTAALILLGLEWAQAVLVPVALAVFLSFLLGPAVVWLQKRGVNKTQSVMITVSVAALGIGVMASIIVFEVGDLLKDLDDRKVQIRDKVRSYFGGEPGLLGRLYTAANQIASDVKTGTDERGNKPAKADGEPDPIVVRDVGGDGTFSWLAGAAAGFTGSAGLVVALTVTILFYREDLRDRIVRLVGYGRMSTTTRAFDEATTRITRYLTIQGLINLAFGTVFAIGLGLLAVPYWLLWGVLGVILRFIPYIGTWLAGVMPLLMSVAATPNDSLRPLGVLAFIVACAVAVNNIIEPIYVSRRTGVSPVALVVAAAFWTWLWGPIGLILSTPITVCMGVIGRHVRGLEFLHVLVGNEPALDPRYSYYQRLLARDEGEAAELLEGYLRDKSWGELADEVLIATLMRAKADFGRGELDKDDVKYVVKVTRDLLDDLAEVESAGAAVILGCPAQDSLDCMALEILGRLTAGRGVRVETMSPGEAAGELIEQVRRSHPAAVCVLGLGPAGLGQVRYFCKRLRAESSGLPVVAVACGVGSDDLAGLKAAGATEAAGSLCDAVRALPGVAHGAESAGA